MMLAADKRLSTILRPGLVLAVSLFVAVSAGLAQQKFKSKPGTKHSSQSVPESRGSGTTASVANVTEPVPVNGYVQPKRDPFEIPARRPHKVEPPPQVRPAPPLQERVRQYTELRNRLRAEGEAPPSAVTAYLVSELEVNGVFKDKDGYGAFVTAKPTNSTFFLRPGEKVFNGTVQKIETQEVRFQEITWMTSGKDVLKDVTKPILPTGK